MTFEDLHAKMRDLVKTTGFSMKSYDKFLKGDDLVKSRLFEIHAKQFKRYANIRKAMLASEELWSSYKMLQLKKMPEQIEMKEAKNELKEALKEVRTYQNGCKKDSA